MSADIKNFINRVHLLNAEESKRDMFRNPPTSRQSDHLSEMNLALIKIKSGQKIDLPSLRYTLAVDRID